MYICCDEEMEFIGVDGCGGRKYYCNECYKIQIHSQKDYELQKKFEGWSEGFLSMNNQIGIAYGILMKES